MLTAAVIEGLSASLLAVRYDDPAPIPDFHPELWELCCSERMHVAIAAPRGHAKSTAVTFAYVIASVLFRVSRHVLVISANESLAAGFLNDIRVELIENEALAAAFGFRRWLKDTESELIGQFTDGEKFRLIAKGANQRMRGIKWERKRPDLVVGDDMEDDEIVMNADRREKFKRWFYGAVLPIGKDGAKFRVVGTIMHMDSLLEGLMPEPKSPDTETAALKVFSDKGPWLAAKYRAHNDDFSAVLWPQRFTADKLRAIRADYAARGLLDVYNQEYLNDPIDTSSAYFRDDDFIAAPRDITRRYYAAVDFAITTTQKADYTVIVVGGVDEAGFLDILDVRRGRWDALEIIDNLFQVQARYNVELFGAEAGAIQKALGPVLNAEMRKRGQYINLHPMTPTKDKQARARSIQARMRSGGVRFETDAEWYPDYHEEMRRFPKGVHDDQVDATAWLGLMLDNMIEAPTDAETEEELYQEEIADMYLNANPVTGY